MTEKRYKAAVVGVGAVVSSGGKKGGGHQAGYAMARSWLSTGRVSELAAADINAENLAAFKASEGVEHGYPSLDELLSDYKPDLLAIATYVGHHVGMIEQAADAGVKGIVCEKPFLAAPAELDRVKAAADRSGVKIVVTHQRRYHPAFELARDLYHDGTVGEPVLCFAGIDGWDLSEWGAHWLDMMRFFHRDADVQWVMGQARVRDNRGYGHAMEEHAIAYFQFEGGGKCLLDGGSGFNKARMGLRLVGTEGTIFKQGAENDPVFVENKDGRRKIDPPAVVGGGKPYQNARVAVAADLIHWIEGGDEPRVALDTQLKTSELNLAAYLSAVRGDRIDLPLIGEDRALDRWPVELLAERHRAAD